MSIHKIIDLHNDAITTLSPEDFITYIKESKAAGVDTILVSVYTTEMINPMQEIKKYRQIIDSINTDTRLLLHIEDAWFVNMQNIDELVSFAPYSVGLTWNQNNDLAGGALDDGNVTQLGKVIIEKLVANGIKIDLAHLNKQSFYSVAEVLETHDQRLLCTHACFDRVHPHPRNLDHGQVQTIVESGGIIGLTLVTDFLGGDIYEHIKYFIENFGEDNLAIGTDFFGTAKLPDGLKKYKDFVDFKKVLLKNGLSKATIDKIFWRNASEYHNRS